MLVQRSHAEAQRHRNKANEVLTHPSLEAAINLLVAGGVTREVAYELFPRGERFKPKEPK